VGSEVLKNALTISGFSDAVTREFSDVDAVIRVKEFSNNAIQEYVIKQIQTLSQEKQEDFNKFKSLSIENKFQKALELNKLNNINGKDKSDNNEVAE